MYLYMYQSATHSGYHAITQSYTVHQTHMKSDCKYNQSTLLNLSTVYKQNDVVIVDP